MTNIPDTNERVNSPTVIFDADDVDYLIFNLSEHQLKKELRHAELEALISAYYEDGWEFYYTDYASAVRLALDSIQMRKPKPSPIKGGIDIEAIKAQHDIVSVVEKYTQLRKVGNRFSGKCPIHDDKNPSLTVYPDNQTWHCFGCQAHGDLFDFIQAVEHTDFKGAATILRGENGL